jgi:GT2 family glycosyltransferase
MEPKMTKGTDQIAALNAGTHAPSTGISMLILIVSYRATDLTIDALASLESEMPTVAGSRVVICENGTGGGAADELRAHVAEKGWGDWVEIREIHPNRGFAGGNNYVLEQLLTWPEPPQSVLLLNADTLVRPGALKTLYDALDEYPDAGVISPRLEWPDGTPQISCFRDFHPLTELDKAARIGVIERILRPFVTAIPLSSGVSRPDWTSFACALIRRETLQRVGVLDSGFFLYFDDPDYCRRVREAGFQIVNVPDAHVVHLRGRSNPLKSLAKAGKRKPWYHYASRARYYTKYYGRGGLLAANLLWMIGHGFAMLRRVITGHAEPAVEHEARDIWTNWSDPMALALRGQDDDGDESRGEPGA